MDIVQHTEPSNIYLAKFPTTTIGVLASDFGDQYCYNILRGIITAAEEYKVNILGFSGRELESPQGFEAYHNKVYELAGEENVSGLILLTGTLSYYTGAAKMKPFITRFAGLPVVSIADKIDGIPNLTVDNISGLRSIMNHLVEDHGYRRIAFIRGAEKSYDAEERFGVYREVLAEHNIPFDPTLVAFGDFSYASSKQAVETLLDVQNASFEALVVGNDAMAIGAMEVLRARNIRIPDDVAMVGFDDVTDAAFVTPPLTTVRQPSLQLGRYALDMIIAMLQGESITSNVTLPTIPVIRQSCGCMLNGIQDAILPENMPALELPTNDLDLLILKKKIASHVLAGEENSDQRYMAVDTLLNALFTDLLADHANQTASDESLIGEFVTRLGEMLSAESSSFCNSAQCHQMLSRIRQNIIPYTLNDIRLVQRTENIFQQARILISDVVARAETGKRVKTHRQSLTLALVSDSMIGVRSEADLTKILRQHLPLLGVKSCYVALYENATQDTAHLILAYTSRDHNQILDLIPVASPGSPTFPSKKLLPEIFWPTLRRYTMVIEPLRFNDEQIGYIIFETVAEDAHLYQLLSKQIGSTLKRIRLAQQLEYERNLMRTMIDNIPDYVFVKDRNGRFILSNTAYAEATQHDAAHHSTPDSFTPDELDVIQLGQSHLNVEQTITSSIGEPNWFLTTKVPLRDRFGQIAGLVGISRDITELKLAEMMLRQLNTDLNKRVELRTAQLEQERKLLQMILDSMGEGLVFTEDARIRYVNDALTRLTGYEETELVDHLDAILVDQPVLNSNMLQFLPQSIQYGIPWRGEAKLRRKDGTYFDAALTITLVLQDDHNLSGITVIRDITDEKQLQEQKSNFLATASHELRTPLTNIMTRLYILRKQPDKFDTHVTVLERAANHMGRLVEDLLDINRFERGTISLRPITVVLQNLIIDAAQSQELEAVKKAILVITELPSEPITVSGDPARLMQVLNNLLVNAINYTPNGGRVTISLSADTGNHVPYAAIKVTDTGAGIAPEHLSRIFEPFFRATDGSVRGTGLGLSIAKDIVEAHGGTLSVESELDIGSTFTAKLEMLVT